MPTDFSNLAVYSVGVISIGTLLWTVYERRRSGAGQLRKEIDEDNAIRRKQLEETVNDLKNEMSRLHTEVSTFKATIVEKDKHILSLTQILQGKNPEMIALLEEIKNHLIDNRKFTETMHSQNKTILDHQTKMLEQRQPRNNKKI